MSFALPADRPRPSVVSVSNVAAHVRGIAQGMRMPTTSSIELRDFPHAVICVAGAAKIFIATSLPLQGKPQIETADWNALSDSVCRVGDTLLAVLPLAQRSFNSRSIGPHSEFVRQCIHTTDRVWKLREAILVRETPITLTVSDELRRKLEIVRNATAPDLADLWERV